MTNDIQFVPIDSINDEGTPKGRDFSGLMNEIRRIKQTFDGVHTKTIDEWVKGFDCDENPEKEIALWLVMADVFERVKTRLPTGKEQEILAALLFYSSGYHTVQGLRHVAQEAGRPIDLTDQELQQVIDAW